ncbi:MAG: rod shape-determining protein RodA [Chloroflexi bacterium]|jgi:rod shape determining protein RodA|nr:rod shape-determining protein RodA [Chloroflexota bacterium]
MLTRKIWQRFDFLLFAVVLLLCVFSVALISSAIAGNPTLAEHPQRQAVFLGIGLVVLFVVASFDYHVWSTLSKPFYIFVAILLLLVFVIGGARFGAARWLETGLVTIQPAELSKIAIILSLASYFSANIERINNWLTISRSLIITLGIVTWILLQPNLSTSIVIFVIWAAMLWISGLKTKYILIMVGVAALFLLISFALDFPYLADYQKARITNFLQPDENARHGDTYNVEQALISIGAGGWFGNGYGQGSQVQLRFLKIRHNDFIFSVLANEFGFVGTVIVVAALVFVIIRCFKVAQNAPDAYGALIAYGFGVLMGFQTIVNVGVNLRLLPVTGLTLPFISYGGSSLVSMLLGIGLVENVHMRSQPKQGKGSVQDEPVYG